MTLLRCLLFLVMLLFGCRSQRETIEPTTITYKEALGIVSGVLVKNGIDFKSIQKVSIDWTEDFWKYECQLYFENCSSLSDNAMIFSYQGRYVEGLIGECMGYVVIEKVGGVF